MYNVSKPTLDDLPSSKQLLRSTLIALVAAIAILVGIVLPSEYAIDPTGIGRVLGLTEMGRSRRNWPKKPLRMPRRMQPCRCRDDRECRHRRACTSTERRAGGERRRLAR